MNFRLGTARRSAMAVSILSTAVMAATAASVVGDDCPNLTTKDIDCPSGHVQSCGGVGTLPFTTIPYCSPLTWTKPEKGPFSNKSNGDNETTTQTDPDTEDMVTCTRTGLCRIKVTDPTKCVPINNVTGNLPTNPLEEIECD